MPSFTQAHTHSWLKRWQKGGGKKQTFGLLSISRKGSRQPSSKATPHTKHRNKQRLNAFAGTSLSPTSLRCRRWDYKLIEQTVWMSASVLRLGESRCSSSPPLSLPPSPCRGKNESLSQQLLSVIPQYRPGFHRRPHYALTSLPLYPFKDMFTANKQALWWYYPDS